MTGGIQIPTVLVTAAVLCGSTLLLFAKPYEQEPPRPVGTPVEPDYGVDFDQAVSLFERRVASNDQDFLSRTMLGRLYVQKAKSDEDGTYFDKAERQFASALVLHPDDAEATLGLASVAMANHHFEKALTLAQSVWDADENQLLALAMVGDAQIELGEYAATAQTYERLAEQLQTAPVLARLSRLNEMQGRPDQAIEQMLQAWDQVRDASATGKDKAWYLQRLGELQLSQGQTDEARQLFSEARLLDPTSRPAIMFLGHTAARTGRLDDAESLYWDALELSDDPGLYAAIGDLHWMRGLKDEARAYYDRAAELWDPSSHGHAHHHGSGRLPGEPKRESERTATHSHSHSNPDAHARSLSLFLSDHALNAERALALARTNLTSRRDVYSYDALAWALYRCGQNEAAEEAAQQALAQGTRDASLWYHMALIQHALGQPDAAIDSLEQVAAINPTFSVLHQQRAQKLLSVWRSEQQSGR